MRSFTLFCLAILTILVLSCAPATPANSQNLEPAAQTAINRLWIDLGISAEFMNWVNNHACSQDISRVNNVRAIDLLTGLHRGQRLVVFRSVADIETLLPEINDKLDIIGYNLESGPENRPDEQADPVGSVRRAQTVARRYNKQLAIGPDHAIALASGVAIAPYVDIFVMQIQRVQTEPQTVRDFVLPLSQALRKANPNIQLAAQIRTEGDVPQLLNMVGSISDHLDGLSILTSPETVDVANDILTRLRPDGFDCSLLSQHSAQLGNNDSASGGLNSSFMTDTMPALAPASSSYRTTFPRFLNQTWAQHRGLLLWIGTFFLLLLMLGIVYLRTTKNEQRKRDATNV
ncbi:MAG: hypothetical protein U0175_08875 [Caldilineaceae bacterium]